MEDRNYWIRIVSSISHLPENELRYPQLILNTHHSIWRTSIQTQSNGMIDIGSGTWPGKPGSSIGATRLPIIDHIEIIIIPHSGTCVLLFVFKLGINCSLSIGMHVFNIEHQIAVFELRAYGVLTIDNEAVSYTHLRAHETS